MAIKTELKYLISQLVYLVVQPGLTIVEMLAD